MDALKLTYADIGNSMEEVESFLQTSKTDSKDIMRTTLVAEEILLTYKDTFGEDTGFSVSCTKRFGNIQVELRVMAESFDPFAKEGEDELSFVHNLLSNARFEPTWVYKKGANRILFLLKPKRQISMIAQILIGFGLGIGLGLAATATLGDTAVAISEKALTPISDTIMGLLTAAAAFLIFLSVANGICNMGDISTFNKIGKKTVGRYLSMLAIYGVFEFVVVLPFTRITTDSITKLDPTVFYDMLLDIVPDNILQPFVAGNTLQIIFLAIFVSVFLLILGDKAGYVKDLITQLNILAQTIVESLIKLLPIVVFVSIFGLTAARELQKLLDSYKLLLLYLLADGIVVVITVLRVCLSKHISPILLFSKMSPSLAIGLATASSLAAYPTTLNIVKNEYGVDDKLADVGIPLGQTIYKPDVIAYLTCISVCMAEIYGIDITPGWLLTLFITSYFMSIAMPPIAGGLFSCVGLLFAQLGIPAEAIAVLIAIDPIMDRISTADVQFTLHSEVIMLGDSLKMLNIDVLRRKKAAKEKNNK